MSYKLNFLTHLFIFCFIFNCFAYSVKEPEFAGQFYPQEKNELTQMLDGFLDKANPKPLAGDIFMLIGPHAGYGYSGQTAAFGYKLVQDKPYKTVIILGTSHHKLFNGAAVYASGALATSLGKLDIDEEFTKKVIAKSPEVFADEAAFDQEHSVEVQLPFLQKVLTGVKIVPVVVGDCSLDSCKKIASIFKDAIGDRRDILVVVSTDFYHGYDLEEADRVDAVTLDLIKKLDYEGLYYALRDDKAQACGGMALVVALDLAKEQGYKDVEVLNHANSAIVTGNKIKGEWTVGYSSCAITYPKGVNMLNNQQRTRLLEIARQSIQTYLQTGKKLQANEADPVLNQKMGAFVTLNQHKELRGCIGNLVGSQPLYLTVRDMAVEAAVDDPRFSALSLKELDTVEIEISALSVLEKINSAEKIELGRHGVLVRRGMNSGVFLPQVATETGWSKEEFLNNLCAHKAGLPADAWKDKDTELYIFNAEVFSEKDLE